QGSFQINLPVTFPGQPASNITVNVPDLQSLATSGFDTALTAYTTFPETIFNSAISSLNFSSDLSTLEDGWGAFFGLLDTVVDNQAFVQKIPLVGDQLVEG